MNNDTYINVSVYDTNGLRNDILIPVSDFANDYILPSGTENQTLRHNGTSWLANDYLKTTTSGIVVTGNIHATLNAKLSGLAGTGTRNIHWGGKVFCDMDATDTATITVMVNGEGADIVDLIASSRQLFMAGVLIC